MQNTSRKRTYSINDIVNRSGVGRSFIYEEIKSGRLVVRKAAAGPWSSTRTSRLGCQACLRNDPNPHS